MIHLNKAANWSKKQDHLYYQISRGIDHRPVQPDRPRKSVGAEDTFAQDIFDPGEARREIILLTEKVWRHCETKGITGRTVTLKVKYTDFQQITRARTVGTAIRDRTGFETLALALLEPLFPTQKGIRLLGVTLSSLEETTGDDASDLQLCLWRDGL